MSSIEDDLTGLHNRRSFLALLRRHVGLANERKTNLALVVVDVDGFARLNAAHGYDFGDRALRHIAQQLHTMARTQDYAARIGDNRFALILPGVMNAGHAELAVQKLFRLFEVPFDGGNGRVRMTATVGVALCPLHATQAEFLLLQAEKSLELARATGQRWLFPPESGDDLGLSELWDLEIELDGAVQRGEMFLVYQPKLRLPDLVPIGAEALMRWRHRSRGLVSPGQFIPIAEQTGQIKRMTIWALNSALRHAGEWKLPHVPFGVAVNVPPELVGQDDLPDLVENALNLWATPDVQLVLEITERSLVMDPRHSFRILSRIRDMGVKISIDDFGTGYSCLAYFKDIPADELKIDRSFVSGMLIDATCADITSLIIDLAHRFGLHVVAEGVEDEETLEALRVRNCDVVQGHLFAKAMELGDFSRWLTDSGDALRRAV
ncbi:putative bifunctional diguanylate cyclase/phosphodiesterase [Lysobacter solisilvae (ex Woo and Kim 2020)]|uniref:Bifunctional diguanylate cyclase/phosphodiesterase n=1 Tax=Agrilutibacter terrestris TaxID=2865112 RepID=A0A7H0FTT4_9GAMM|nr:bifunctional diguanylate cyclase/phosphodiesterase [Lysobacter terrestris]QNP39450.1 bifunctional diguanylate cyclase/phosphodiesterase [Lysobacter terrestris]